MLTTHYTGKAAPATVKKKRAQNAHVGPPLKGLSEENLTTIGDAGTATILSNFSIENSSIRCRAGYRKIATRGTAPVWCLVPYYGTIPQLAAASNKELWNAQNGTLLKSGFTSDDWYWTAFANIGQQKYTVMVNGQDGVWSWNGGFAADGAAVTVAAGGISKTNPAVVTVAAADISKFSNGIIVKIAGATGDFAVANGNWVIDNVGTPVNTFRLPLVNTSTATGTSNAGVTATPLGSFVKETVTAPVVEGTWININQFQIVVAHQNRLFFADNTHLVIYYLPLQQKTGEVKYLPMNNMFRRGGNIRAMYTWTRDGGAGMDDLLVVFSSNGECVIWSGIDPASDFIMVGIFRFDSPMSKHSITQYGGELYVLISTGLVPMSAMMKAETDQLGIYDKSVVSIFRRNAISYRNDLGWQTFLNPSSGRLFCNMPQGANNVYKQMIRHMPNTVWSMYENIPARCWNWVDPYVYFGDDSGNVYQMHPAYLNDDGKEIVADLQTAWSDYRSAANKHFLVIQSYLTTSGGPRPAIDMKVNFDMSKGRNVPDVRDFEAGAIWDEAVWDVDYWASGEHAVTVWNGVAPIDHVGAIRLTVSVKDCSFAVNGFDVVFEAGNFGP